MITADGTPSQRAPEAPPGGLLLVSLSEALDVNATAVLRDRLSRVLDTRPGQLVVDLSQVPVCDVAGLAVLIGIQHRARWLGVSLWLAAPSPAVEDVLRSTGLEQRFLIRRDGSGPPRADRPWPGPVPAQPRARPGSPRDRDPRESAVAKWLAP